MIVGWWLVLVAVSAPVDVQVEGCPGVSEHEVRRLVRVELANAQNAGAGIDARVECKAGGTAVVRVDDPVTKKSLSRAVGIAKVPSNALARSLALAIVELVEASWAELTLKPPRDGEAPAPVEPLTPAVTEARAELETSPGPVVLEAFGVGRRSPASALWQWGGGARVSWWATWLGASLDVDAALGERRMSLGVVSVFAASFALWFRAQIPVFGPFTAVGGLGGRVGLGSVTGTPYDPQATRGDSVVAAWLGPSAQVGVEAHWGRWLGSVAFEAGTSLVGVRGTVAQSTGPGLLGPWFSVLVGVGARP